MVDQHDILTVGPNALCEAVTDLVHDLPFERVEHIKHEGTGRKDVVHRIHAKEFDVPTLLLNVFVDLNITTRNMMQFPREFDSYDFLERMPGRQ
jgi:hypothetical protein